MNSRFKIKSRLLKTKTPTIPYTAGALAFLFTLAACTNSVLRNFSNSSTLRTPTGTASPTGSTTTDSHVISSATITTPAGAANNAAPITNIFFDTSKSTAQISSHCNVGGGAQTSKPCNCQFSWTEVNSNSGSSAAVPRTVQTPVTAVQSSFINCSAPDVFLTEITNGTQIKITVMPGPSNGDSGIFKVSTYTFTKNSVAVVGSFQDSNGQIFDNVLHYACYEKFKRGMSITSFMDQETSSTNPNEQRKVYHAAKFCVVKAGSPGGPTQSCPHQALSDFSAQANYFNLYIRNSEQGDINQFNDSHVCPLVKETLNSNSSVGTQNQVWPLDATFALSLGKTSTFNIGVEGLSRLSVGNDPSVGNTTCSEGQDGGAAQPAGTSGLIRSCLGFAAKPNPDGTCPYFKDSIGQIRFTYRLRRYVAIYPRLFDTNGSPLSQPQGIDQIYVLDRPVKGPANSDPLKPYTMLGPKPCPFSYFDKKGVTDTVNATPLASYVATTNSKWSGKNVDGIEFPNFDSLQNESCSAALPIPNSTKTAFTFRTINIFNPNSTYRHQYIRPYQSFLPHYEEDTTFQACAPQAYPLRDAPLHFSRDANTGNVAWCLESYPTQNSYISSLDRPVTPTSAPTVPTGLISNYTSHVQKNSSSNSCLATNITIPTSNYSYPAAGAAIGFARHSSATTWEGSTADRTCDRTAVEKDLAWPRFPLLAAPSDIESDRSISSDTSYFCTLTYDGNGTKTNKYTPTDGCCDRSVVQVQTGTSGNSTAHLEPDVSCKTPAY